MTIDVILILQLSIELFFTNVNLWHMKMDYAASFHVVGRPSYVYECQMCTVHPLQLQIYFQTDCSLATIDIKAGYR